MKKILFVFTLIFYLVSCDQYVSREFGGNTIIKLEPGERLVEVTWKGEADLWYLVEPMDSDYTPKTKIFKERSVLDVLNGQVTFIESK